MSCQVALDADVTDSATIGVIDPCVMLSGANEVRALLCHVERNEGSECSALSC